MISRTPPEITYPEMEQVDGIFDIFGGGVTVQKYLLGYDDEKNGIDLKTTERLLWGMTIRPTGGKDRKKKCTFGGLVPYYHNGTLIIMYLVSTANRELIDTETTKCAVFINDNQTNERLRRLVSGDNLLEKNYLEIGHLEGKWQVLLLGQNSLNEKYLTTFMSAIAKKCGKQNGNFIHIHNEEELKTKLQAGVQSSTEILLCVTEGKNDPIYSTVKREVELKRGKLTKCCSFKTVNDCTAREEQTLTEEEPTLTNIGLDMVAKTGVYRDKSFFLNSAIPSRFVKTKYLGCKMRKIDAPFVLVGNIGGSECSASGYECRVARGNDIKNLGEIFDQLLKKDKRKNETEKFIYFREGFVPGRHEDELRREVDILKKVAKDISVTCIVCQKTSGPGTVSVGDGKTSYRIFLDEIGFSYWEFETLIKNLLYSRRYQKPLPAIYADRAAELAEVYMDGKEGCDLNKIAETIDKSLYVIGERETTKR